MKISQQLSFVLLSGLATFAACAQSIPPERAEAAREALVAWLDCMDCSDRELDELAKYGPEVVNALERTARQGLSPAKRGEIEDRLMEQYHANEWDKSQDQEQNRKAQKVYLDTYVSNADKKYRTRAITGLARIGTDEAIKALRRVKDDEKAPADVRAAADKVLKPRREL